MTSAEAAIKPVYTTFGNEQDLNALLSQLLTESFTSDVRIFPSDSSKVRAVEELFFPEINPEDLTKILEQDGIVERSYIDDGELKYNPLEKGGVSATNDSFKSVLSLFANYSIIKRIQEYTSAIVKDAQAKLRPVAQAVENAFAQNKDGLYRLLNGLDDCSTNIVARFNELLGGSRVKSAAE